METLEVVSSISNYSIFQTSIAYQKSIYLCMFWMLSYLQVIFVKRYTTTFNCCTRTTWSKNYKIDTATKMELSRLNMYLVTKLVSQKTWSIKVFVPNIFFNKGIIHQFWSKSKIVLQIIKAKIEWNWSFPQRTKPKTEYRRMFLQSTKP